MTHEDKKHDEKPETMYETQKKEVKEKHSETHERKSDEKKEEKKKIQKIKKTEVTINVTGIPISYKTGREICRFIKNKKIDDALKDLEDVVKKKKAVPMRGEIPHRRGKIMAGRFPFNASKEFIVLLKSLKSNADNHDVDEPVIIETITNKSFQPYGRFGRIKKKRASVYLRAVSLEDVKKMKKLNKSGGKK